MVRKFVFLKRKVGTDAAFFSNYWRNSHSQLIANLPQFWDFSKQYIQNHSRQPVAGLTPEPIWDGIVETLQHLQVNYLKDFSETREYLSVVRPDEPNFIEPGQAMKLFAEERVIIDGPRQGIKMLILARRAPNLSLRDFQQYWYDKHSLEIKNNSGLSKLTRRYVQHHVLPESVRPDHHRGYDGIVEMWFDSVADAVSSFNAPSYLSAVREDERRFVADPPSPRLVVDETHIPQPS